MKIFSMERKTNSFILFGRAFKNAKKDFWVSIQVLFWITIVLALLFWWEEGKAQPDVYGSISGLFQSFVWAITRYIGDPGHFAGDGPITLTGRWIDTGIGILKILIFAVPAGLVANGFKKAMDDEKRARHLEACADRIRLSFKRLQNKKTLYRFVSRRMPIVTLQAKKDMKEGDIIDTIRKYDEFRLRNLATSQTANEHPQDRLVIEMLPLNKKSVDGFNIERTSYGIKIDRGSNVTIVSPSSALENSIGFVSYYMAQFGGFNYVSRECVNDIKNMSNGKVRWNIVIISADNVHDTQFHFVHRASEKSGLQQTTLDEEQFNKLYSTLADKIREEYEFLSDLDEKYRPVGKKNIGVITGGGTSNNAFTIRISYSVTTWSDVCPAVVVEMARIIKEHLEKPGRNKFEENPSWKKKGCGYGVDEQE